MTRPAPPQRHWLRRLGWLALIWAASVAVLGGVALAIRIVMNMAGLTA